MIPLLKTLSEMRFEPKRLSSERRFGSLSYSKPPRLTLQISSHGMSIKYKAKIENTVIDAVALQLPLRFLTYRPTDRHSGI